MAAVTVNAACCASEMLSANAVTHNTRPPLVTTSFSLLMPSSLEKAVPAWNTFTASWLLVSNSGKPAITSPFDEVSG